MNGNRFYVNIRGIASICWEAILVLISPELSKLTVGLAIREDIVSGLTTRIRRIIKE